MARQMLIKDPDQRIAMDDVWRHKWLEGFTHIRAKQAEKELNDYVLEQVYQKMEKLGLPRSVVIETINNGVMNHVSATFYLYTRKLL